jgi:glycerol-3-phosphate acyltransferase PlsY
VPPSVSEVTHLPAPPYVINITEAGGPLPLHREGAEVDGGGTSMIRVGRLVSATFAAYLLGSVQSADIVARLAARVDGSVPKDLRAHGTGNPGGLNAAKVLGTSWGLAVIAADVAKGALASSVGRKLAGDAGAYAAGTGAVIGHCLPIWSRFRGGKGIATSAGTAAVCFPAYMPVDLAVAGGTLGLSRGQANFSAYMASTIFTVASILWWRTRRANLWGPAPTIGLPLYAVATSAVICWRFFTAPVRSTDVLPAVSAEREEVFV